MTNQQAATIQLLPIDIFKKVISQLYSPNTGQYLCTLFYCVFTTFQLVYILVFRSRCEYTFDTLILFSRFHTTHSISIDWSSTAVLAGEDICELCVDDLWRQNEQRSKPTNTTHVTIKTTNTVYYIWQSFDIWVECCWSFWYDPGFCDVI